MNGNPRSLPRLAGIIASCLVASSWIHEVHAGDPRLSADVREAAHAVGDAAREVGKDLERAARQAAPTARKAGHTVAHAARQAGRAVAHAARQAGTDLKHAAAGTTK
jgi:hypothetical protein